MGRAPANEKAHALCSDFVSFAGVIKCGAVDAGHFGPREIVQRLGITLAVGAARVKVVEVFTDDILDKEKVPNPLHRLAAVVGPNAEGVRWTPTVAVLVLHRADRAVIWHIYR